MGCGRGLGSYGRWADFRTKPGEEAKTVPTSQGSVAQGQWAQAG